VWDTPVGVYSLLLLLASPLVAFSMPKLMRQFSNQEGAGDYGLVTDFLVRDANKKAPPQRSLSDPRLSRQVQLRLHFGERRCTDGFLLRCAQDNDCDTGPAPISRVHSAPEKQLDVSDAGRALFTDAVSSM
jgi:hypothetical protein